MTSSSPLREERYLDLKALSTTNNSWETPELLGLNRLPPRSTRRRPGDDNASWALSLDGEWDFCLYESPACVPEASVVGDGDSHHKISVPGNWTVDPAVADQPQYVNVQMPFYVQYPHVPQDRNPVGVYRRNVDHIPAAWRNNRRTVLHLGGFESCCYVYWNGKFVGMSKDSRLGVEWDVTFFLCDQSSSTSRNVLSVVVLRWSDGSFLEQQDHWRMAGLHRSVYLYNTPNTFIEDVFCRPELILPDDDDDRTKDYYRGRLHVQARIGRTERLEGKNMYYAETLYDKGHRIVVQLLDPAGKALFSQPVGADNVPGGILRAHLTAFTIPIAEEHVIQPWSHETHSPLYSHNHAAGSRRHTLRGTFVSHWL